MCLWERASVPLGTPHWFWVIYLICSVDRCESLSQNLFDQIPPRMVFWFSCLSTGRNLSSRSKVSFKSLQLYKLRLFPCTSSVKLTNECDNTFTLQVLNLSFCVLPYRLWENVFGQNTTRGIRNSLHYIFNSAVDTITARPTVKSSFQTDSIGTQLQALSTLFVNTEGRQSVHKLYSSHEQHAAALAKLV